MYFYQIKCCFVIRIYSVTGRRYVMKKVDELTKHRREMDRVRENISGHTVCRRIVKCPNIVSDYIPQTIQHSFSHKVESSFTS